MSCEIYTNGSNPSLNFSVGNIPPGFCPTNWQEVLTQFANLLIGTFPGNFATFVIGSDVPAADDQDKLWFRLDAANACAPLGWFIFHAGTWIRAQPHPILPGTIIDYYNSVFATYVGTQAQIDEAVRLYVDALETSLDLTPGANPFWYVCDGTRGTPDLRARVRLGAGGTAAYTMVIDGTVVPAAPVDPFMRTLHPHIQGALGGEEDHLLLTSEVPSTPSATGSGSGGVYTQATNQTHNNMPPYLAIYPIMKTARLF